MRTKSQYIANMTLKQSILATLAYHDIFDYPLTEQETYSYLIVKTSYPVFGKSLRLLIKEKRVFQKDGHLYLQGRGQIVGVRESRKKTSSQKLKRAAYYAKILRFIPTIKLLAISGALSMENADANDDIDLVIVTSKGSLWTTRLLANLILWPYRRKAGESHTKDKACLNLFLEEASLKIGTQNLYTAHELAQVKPIWQRGKTYQRLIKANSWVKNYLPNWKPQLADSIDTDKRHKTKDKRGIRALVISRFALVIETFAKKFQLRYMKKRITTEKIGESQLFFHPGNTQQYILGKYEAKLKSLHRTQGVVYTERSEVR